MKEHLSAVGRRLIAYIEAESANREAAKKPTAAPSSDSRILPVTAQIRSMT